MSTISNGIDIDYQLMASLFIILQLRLEKKQTYPRSFWNRMVFQSDVSNYQHSDSVALGYLSLDAFNFDHVVGLIRNL